MSTVCVRRLRSHQKRRSKLITTLIQKRLLRNPSERPAEVGKRFWSAVTTAAVARAAVQLARLATLDCSELCPEGLLSLRTAREKTALPRGSTSAASRQSAAGSSDTMQLFDHPTGGSTLTGGVGATPSEATLTDAAESVGNGMGNHTPSQPSLPTTLVCSLDATRSPLALSTKPKARVRAGGGESTVGGPSGGGSSGGTSGGGLPHGGPTGDGLSGGGPSGGGLSGGGCPGGGLSGGGSSGGGPSGSGLSGGGLSGGGLSGCGPSGGGTSGGCFPGGGSLESGPVAGGPAALEQRMLWD